MLSGEKGCDKGLIAVRTNPEVLQLSGRNQWHTWLEEHHADTPAIVLVLYKAKYRACGLALDEAVEEALCFGWIDSTLRSLDDRRYLLRFTPRRRNSVWSIRNIRQVERLISEGRVTPAGMRRIAEAKQGGAWEAAGALALHGKMGCHAFISNQCDRFGSPL